MNDIEQTQKENALAVERERQQLIDKINELESILGIAHIDRSHDTFTQLRWRVRVLKHQTASRLDNSTEEEWKQPIIYGDFLKRTRSLFKRS